MKLIPRSVLFGAANKFNALISPDGKYISFLAPKEGIINIWVAPSDDLSKAVCVSDDKKRGIPSYHWTYLSGVLIYQQDQGGDENFALFKVSVETKVTTKLSGDEKCRVDINQLHPKQPEYVLVSMNDRDPKYMDYHKMNLLTGERKLMFKNEAGYSNIIFDSQFRPRAASIESPDGSTNMLLFDSKTNTFELESKVPFEDAMGTYAMMFAGSDNELVVVDSRGRDTSVLKVFDPMTRKEKVLAEHPKSDVASVELHPYTQSISAMTFNYLKTEWVFFDANFQKHVEYLQTQNAGELYINSRSLDDKKWLVSYIPDNATPKVFLYETDKQKMNFLYESRPELNDYELAPMEPRIIRSRDGLDLVCYLTKPLVPLAGEGKPSPMVLYVHGGPWTRDIWGFDPDAQWLANRGYAVLFVNFRGSTGLGKAFVNAGNKEWAGKMHDDLIDACQWAVGAGIADPKKIAIYGGSYGGYAALVGVTFTPDFFACAVDVVGPSNINTLLSTIPPYWESKIAKFKTRIGDFTIEEGKKFLHERSPISKVDQIRKPLLILQGANDPRVKQDEADQIYNAMKAKNIPVDYVIFPDEGHSIREPKNRIAANALKEKFLAEHLGGRLEVITDEIQKSSAKIQN